jgi:uncharacterized membrane protein YgdD (TMEM256/DUF423 family)
MQKQYVILSGLFIMISIVLGAMGAHALKKSLTVEQLNSFETGVKYQMYHALFLLFIGATQIITLKEKTIIFYLTLTGVFFFSGSIYVLTTNGLTGIKSKLIGPITPIGGLLLILSWGYLFYAILTKK